MTGIDMLIVFVAVEAFIAGFGLALFVFSERIWPSSKRN